MAMTETKSSWRGSTVEWLRTWEAWVGNQALPVLADFVGGLPTIMLKMQLLTVPRSEQHVDSVSCIAPIKIFSKCLESLYSFLVYLASLGQDQKLIKHLGSW